MQARERLLEQKAQVSLPTTLTAVSPKAFNYFKSINTAKEGNIKEECAASFLANSRNSFSIHFDKIDEQSAFLRLAKRTLRL